MPGGSAPRSGVPVFQDAVLIQKLHIERLGEILSQIVGSARLQRFSVQHHRLHAVRGDRARELFLFGLSPGEYGDRQHLFRERLVDVQHADGLLHRLFLGGVNGVPFLPQKLARAAKRGA